MSSSDPGVGGDSDVVNLVLVLDLGQDVDLEVHERLSRRLRAEIADLDLVSIGFRPAGPAPAGAKGAGDLALGAVLVALSASGGVFTALIATVRDWLGRQSGRHRISVTIDGDTIELGHAPAEQQQELVDAYIRRHSGH